MAKFIFYFSYMGRGETIIEAENEFDAEEKFYAKEWEGLPGIKYDVDCDIDFCLPEEDRIKISKINA